MTRVREHFFSQTFSYPRTLVLACVLIGAATLLHAQTFDLVIAGGRVIDPESGLDATRNIGISGRTIAAISDQPLTGRTTVNAAGLVVSPGFIDLHAHGQTPETYRYQALDGVTTALELEVGASDIERWYAERKAGALINYGVSIGHIPVRMAVMRDPGAFLPTGSGAHKAASSAEIKEMVRRIEDGLKKGAVSIGAGFPYTPAATREELVDVFRIASRNHVPVMCISAAAWQGCRKRWTSPPKQKRRCTSCTSIARAQPPRARCWP